MAHHATHTYNRYPITGHLDSSKSLLLIVNINLITHETKSHCLTGLHTETNNKTRL